VSPGEVLRAEFLEPLQLRAGTVARAIGVPRNRLSGILNGSRAITADTALRLGIYFGTSAEFWLSLQASYDLKRARRAIGERLRREITPRAA
jgi:addiction module HigA family antidote